MQQPTDLDVAQARWLLHQRWVDNSTLQKHLAIHTSSGSDQDFASYMSENGFISNDQALVVKDRTIGSNERGHRTYALKSEDDAGLLRPGANFRDYRLVFEIARGGMGVVYKALHRQSKSNVALKFIRHGTQVGDALTRFQREAAALVTLKHPNIVEILDAGIDSGQLFYAMEFLDGQTLFDHVADFYRETGQFAGLEQLRDIFIQIAGAVQYCHSKNVVHRDLKPQNIFVETETERAVLVDFGLIKEVASDSHGLTESHQRLGTPRFMAPEQFVPGDVYGEIGPETDVWALAICLYYCLSGQYPYTGATGIEVFEKILKSKPTPIRAINSTVPESIETLLQNCLTLKASERASIEDFIKTLSETSEQPNSGRSTLAILLVTGLLVLLSVGWWFLSSGGVNPASVQWQCPTRVVSRTSSVALDITATPALSKPELFSVRLPSGKLIPLNSVRTSQIQLIDLTPGLNTVVLDIQHNKQSIAKLKTSIFYDSDNPELLIEGADFLSAPVDLRKSRRLRGRCKDLTSVELTIDGQKTELTEDGRFEHVVEAGFAACELKLKATDEALNTTQRVVSVLPPLPNASEVRERWLSRVATTPQSRETLNSLVSRAAWRSIDKSQQRLISRRIAGSLGPAVTFFDVEPIEFEGRQYPVASFRVGQPQLKFVLIPGDVFKIPVVEPDADEQRILALQRCLGDRPFAHSLRAVLTFPLSEDSFLQTLKALNLKPTEEVLRWLEQSVEKRSSGVEKLLVGVDIEKYQSAVRQLWKRELEQVKTRASISSKEFFIPPFLCLQTELESKVRQGKRQKQSSIDMTGAIVGQLSDWQVFKSRFKKVNFSLPSRLQWRYATMAGEPGPVFWSTEGDPQTYLIKQLPRTSDIKPNSFGLLDTLGSFEELCVGNLNLPALKQLYPGENTEIAGSLVQSIDKRPILVGGMVLFPADLCTSNLARFPSTVSKSSGAFRIIIELDLEKLRDAFLKN